MACGQGRSPFVKKKVNLIGAKLDMGKPPFEASEGGLFEILRLWKGFTPSELYFRKEMGELLRQKARLETSPNGSPMSISKIV